MKDSRDLSWPRHVMSALGIHNNSPRIQGSELTEDGESRFPSPTLSVRI
jgi:hypothetical protein